MATVLWTVTVGAAGSTTAGAEVGGGAYPTSQAVAADAQFLEYAPPPAHPGVVCLVDSGVDPNPDTTAALVGAEAEVPAWGTGDALAQTQPLVEGHPAGHGTEMAMLMAAPQNGWGMVGIAPTSVRVYSIRVVPPGETGFPFSGYSYAINRCLELRLTTQPAITVINLSVAGTITPANSDLTELQHSVDDARHHGMDVVGAGGNDGANGPYYPAAYPSVLAVGAGDAGSGALCTFSNHSALAVVAPGCDSLTGGIDEVFQDDGSPALGFGTSQAAAQISSVLAAMRAYEPSLTDAQAEACLKDNEGSGGNLDASAAFSACGLRRIVDAGLAAITAPPNALTDAAATDSSPPSDGTPRPAVRGTSRELHVPRLRLVRVRGGGLRVEIANRPNVAATELRMLGRQGGRVVVLAHRRSIATSVTFRIGSAIAIEARFITRGRPVTVSRWITQAIL